MDHQSFRYYIPGIVFLVPIYLVICWITLNYYTNSDFRIFILLGGITTFPVIALPVGWWIYNAYRVWWLTITKGGYENKEFVKLIRKNTRPFFSPLIKSFLIDFTHLRGINSWIKIEPEIFRKTFYPFTSKKKFQTDIEQLGIHPKFTEPISDYILFKDESYDYARSISSIRYGLESSVFAIALSIPYALGIRFIWLFYLKEATNQMAFLLWITIIVIFTIFIIFTLFKRWIIADKEYDARLLLTTLTSVDNNFFDTKIFEEKIPAIIVKKIERLCLKNNPYAAFDLDNTILCGEIGEAVFATLVKKELVKNFNWRDYKILLSKNQEVAYKKIINVMEGLEVTLVSDITRELLESGENKIRMGDDFVPVPKPNIIMQSITSLLKTKGIEIFVVTASNKISAEIVCWKYFGIPYCNVLGAEVHSDWNGRIVPNLSDIPYGEGKVIQLKKVINSSPIITGGDGIWDKYLLDYTDPNGIRLWLGKNKSEFIRLKNKFYYRLNFYHVAS